MSKASNVKSKEEENAKVSDDQESEKTTEQMTDRQRDAESMVRKNAVIAAGIGIVPIPVFDFLGVSSLQLNMLRQLSNLYDVEFMKNKGKNFIGALVGGVVPAVSSIPLAVLVKGIPVVGITIGAGAMSILSGASTFAIGHVFIRHFETGGTFLDFKPAEFKEDFAKVFKKGKTVVTEEQREGDAKVGAKA